MWAWGKAGHYYLLQEWTQTLFMCTTRLYLRKATTTTASKSRRGNDSHWQQGSTAAYHKILQWGTNQRSRVLPSPHSHLSTVKLTRQLPSVATPWPVTAGVAKYPNCKRFECGLNELLPVPKLTIHTSGGVAFIKRARACQKGIRKRHWNKKWTPQVGNTITRSHKRIHESGRVRVTKHT